MSMPPDVAEHPHDAPGTFVDTADEIKTPHCRAFFRNWQNRCQGRLMPAKGDLQPFDFAPSLPYMTLVAVGGIDDPMDYRFRLSGTFIDEISGVVFTNKRFRDVTNSKTPVSVYDEYVAVHATGRPRLSYGSHDYRDRGYITFERLLVPVGEDGKTVDHIFGAFGFGRLDRPLQEHEA
jgi:hypothetical protein